MQSRNPYERSSGATTKPGSETPAYWFTSLSRDDIEALKSREAQIALRQRTDDQLSLASHIATALPSGTEPIHLKRYGRSLLAGNPSVMADAATRGIIPWVSLPDATRDGDRKSIPVSVHPLRCESTVEARDRLDGFKAKEPVSETYTELDQAQDLYELAAATLDEGEELDAEMKLFGKFLRDLDDDPLATPMVLDPKEGGSEWDLATVTTNLRERVTNKIFPDQTTKTMKSLRASSKQSSVGDPSESSLSNKG